jgi:beta-glucosidase
MVRVSALALVLAALAPAVLAQPAQPAPLASVVQRADYLLGQMTEDEKLSIVHGRLPLFIQNRPADIVLSAGIVPGVPRLGIPDLRESDASLGVANAGRDNDDAVALPSALMLASTFDPEIAEQGGAMIGKEARQKGFNVLLAGGVDLVREPRNGRNFEYLGEDPLLAGRLAGAAVRGVQSNRILSTVKHYVLNAQESGRHILDAVIDPAALRESDLLAFEIAIEHGRPGAVMCAYNKVNGLYACENKPLFDILKDDWRYPGFVMSDWGAVHSATAAVTGLDQESGEQLDKQAYYGSPLKDAVATSVVPQSRLDDMVRRILIGMGETGVLDAPFAPDPLNTNADAIVAHSQAEAGIVLLKNTGGVLPLAKGARRIAVIGGHADIGVLSGGGSSQVIPLGSHMFKAPAWAPPWGPGMVYHPSSPLGALRALAGAGEISFDAGTDPISAANAARGADVAVVFATQWTTEGADVSLTLPDNQDAVIAAVAAANPRTVVVLETGGPVLMPWLGQVPAVVEAWYPGQRGGEAIAEVLTGAINPAGRLPVTFPAALTQLPRPKLDGEGMTESADLSAGKPFTVTYREGAEVGYRWFEQQRQTPLFPFGWGLGYSAFRYEGLTVRGGATLTVSFRVTNTGGMEGTETPQVYAAAPGETRRLIGFRRIALHPGESRVVTVTADPRLLARFDDAAKRWRIPRAAYTVTAGRYAGDPEALTASAEVDAASLQP